MPLMTESKTLNKKEFESEFENRTRFFDFIDIFFLTSLLLALRANDLQAYEKAYKNMSKGARGVADWLGSVEGKED